MGQYGGDDDGLPRASPVKTEPRGTDNPFKAAAGGGGGGEPEV